VQKRPLILLELNEVNLDIARAYVSLLGLKNFGRLFEQGVRKTTAEARYEDLEPWIQWVSVHSGLSRSEHGIFRLGDIVGSQVPQFFEQVERAGFRVGAVSPMNAENRLESPAYFIPDPWTHTPTDGSGWSRHLWRALSQVVNDNASGRLAPGSAAVLLAGLLRFARPRHYGLYLELSMGAIKHSWRRALLLDLFLHDLHMRLYVRHRPNFSTLFLNAGAHIQHHYLFNSRLVPPSPNRNPTWYVDAKVDPFGEMLRVYDVILGDYLDMPDTNFLLATGLTQQPYDRIKFYWRLRNHESFLQTVGMRFARVLPRMTRDFVVEFDDVAQAEAGQALLASLQMVEDGAALFGDIDNRGTSLFATLTYPKEIRPGMQVAGSTGSFELAPHVVFVAIKNGMHAPHGYVVGTSEVTRLLPADGEHVKSLHATVLRYFGVSQTALGAPPSKRELGKVGGFKSEAQHPPQWTEVEG
jgi:hypothetical protein